MTGLVSQLKENYERVLARAAAAALSVGRVPEEVTVVSVTKTWPAETVLAAYEAGMRQFGENRPEELSAKRSAVESVLGKDAGVVWHLIGPLQSRKSRLAAADVDLFHALDRIKIARRLSDQLATYDRTMPVLLEVNVSGEASKGGCVADNWEADAGQQRALFDLIATLHTLPRIALCGLMTMAPWQAPDSEVAKVFQRTRALKEWLEQEMPDVRLPLLSMGMTDDFEIAVAAGATHIRVGRAIFGSRPK